MCIVVVSRWSYVRYEPRTRATDLTVAGYAKFTRLPYLRRTLHINPTPSPYDILRTLSTSHVLYTHTLSGTTTVITAAVYELVVRKYNIIY